MRVYRVREKRVGGSEESRVIAKRESYRESSERVDVEP